MSTPAKTSSKPTLPGGRKPRVARRARRTVADSDDEPERAAHSSDSEHSTSNSDASDSESISSSEDELNTPAAPATATDHSVSPPSRRSHRKVTTKGHKPATGPSDVPSIVAPSLIPSQSADWADLVAQDEGLHGSAPPIIDFADFVSQGVDALAVAGPSQIDNDEAPAPDAAESTPGPASSGRGRSKPRGGKTQRQAYLERLSEDPSFIPRVGAFWGHDERLFGPELRGMSDWWRGRWNGRGRGANGRGRGRGRERGNGGERGLNGGANEAESSGQAPPPAPSPPPIERTWGHDGYEKMKEQEQTQPARGGLRGRGRARGRGSGPSNLSRKPEQLWTKAPDTHLHVDPSTRPQFPGQGRGIKINVPGQWRPTIVRLAPTTAPAPTLAPTSKSKGSDTTEIIVKLPGQQAKVVPVTQNKPTLPEDPVTVLALQEAAHIVVARLPNAPPDNINNTHTTGSLHPETAPAVPAAVAPKPKGLLPYPVSALPAQVRDKRPSPIQPKARPEHPTRAPTHGRTRSQLDAVAFAPTAFHIPESSPLAFGSLPGAAPAPPAPEKAPAEPVPEPTPVPASMLPPGPPPANASALAITVPAPIIQGPPQPAVSFTPPPANAYSSHNPYAYSYTPLDGAAYYSTATPPPPPAHMYYPGNSYFVPPRPSGPVSIRAPGENMDEGPSRAAPAPPMWNYYSHNSYYSPSGTPYPPPHGYYPAARQEYPPAQPAEYPGMYEGYAPPGAVYY